MTHKTNYYNATERIKLLIFLFSKKDCTLRNIDNKTINNAGILSLQS